MSNVIPFRTPQADWSRDLHSIAARLSAALGGRASVADIPEVSVSDDGTPSLGVPLSANDTVVVTPSDQRQRRYAVLHMGPEGVSVLARSSTADEVVKTISARA